jgi:hypothetical protein
MPSTCTFPRTQAARNTWLPTCTFQTLAILCPHDSSGKCELQHCQAMCGSCDAQARASRQWIRYNYWHNLVRLGESHLRFGIPAVHSSAIRR